MDGPWRRRTETLFDVPVAVSAFSNALIGELNLENINDIARYTPGFLFNSAFGRQEDRPVIRGVGSILNGVAAIGSAATFVDGVFVGGSVTSTELLNVERVEIIKRSQAAQPRDRHRGGARACRCARCSSSRASRSAWPPLRCS